MSGIKRFMGRGRAGRRRRVALSTVMLVVLLMTTIQSASAGLAWCRTDPLLLIDGRVVDVTVSGPLTALLEVTGPTKVQVVVPQDTKALVVIQDLGFGRGYDTSIVQSKKLKRTLLHNEVEVRVYVPARNNSMPVRVDVAPGLLKLLSPVSAEGKANTWITLKVKVPR